MIKVRNLSFSYTTADQQVIKRVNLDVSEGQLVLLTGVTGGGKSTLLKLINGLAPHFTGGRFEGQIFVSGQDATGKLPHQLAESIGYVNQKPEGAFATDTVESELVFGMEQLGMSRGRMQTRLIEISEQFELTPFLNFALTELSAGWQQRVAIAAALAAGQRVLLLDEPTSALDEATASGLIDLLAKLAHTDGLTILVAEHRIAGLARVADQILELNGDGSIESAQLAVEDQSIFGQWPRVRAIEPFFESPELNRNFEAGFRLGPLKIELKRGEIQGLTGSNGSGKSTLLWELHGAAKTAKISTALVPQNAGDILIFNSIAEELACSDEAAANSKVRTSKIFETLAGRIDPKMNPRDLSAGQQLSLALAVQLVRNTDLILLDEPTRGLDQRARLSLAETLTGLRNSGSTIVLATHDQPFLSSIADETIELENGQVLNRVKHAE